MSHRTVATLGALAFALVLIWAGYRSDVARFTHLTARQQEECSDDFATSSNTEGPCVSCLHVTACPLGTSTALEGAH